MIMKNENYIDHEIRIRMLELLSAKIDKHLMWILALCGGILTSIAIPVVLHIMKLV